MTLVALCADKHVGVALIIIFLPSPPPPPLPSPPFPSSSSDRPAASCRVCPDLCLCVICPIVCTSSFVRIVLFFYSAASALQPYVFCNRTCEPVQLPFDSTRIYWAWLLEQSNHNLLFSSHNTKSRVWWFILQCPPLINNEAQDLNKNSQLPLVQLNFSELTSRLWSLEDRGVRKKDAVNFIAAIRIMMSIFLAHWEPWWCRTIRVSRLSLKSVKFSSMAVKRKYAPWSTRKKFTVKTLLPDILLYWLRWWCKSLFLDNVTEFWYNNFRAKKLAAFICEFCPSPYGYANAYFAWILSGKMLA